MRYDRKISKDTALKFMTDGILLRELQEDFLLAKYSSIIIDEAHERSLNTDLLLGTPFCYVNIITMPKRDTVATLNGEAALGSEGFTPTCASVRWVAKLSYPCTHPPNCTSMGYSM